MSASSKSRSLVPSLAIAALLPLFHPETLPADETGQRIQEHITAGEFSVARELAEASSDAQLRNRWFGEISSAQAQVGARHAAVETAGYIDDDQLRNQKLRSISERPIGESSSSSRGGGVAADFDSLIDLMTSTIAPESWDEVGGPGSIEEFAAGVYVNTRGVLHRIATDPGSEALAAVRNKSAESTGNTDVRRSSSLRKVSLRRLERQCEMLMALGRDPSEVMMSLAGIYKIQYVLVYPELGDVVLAGPAGDWHIDAEGRKINTETGKPVLDLDDLVVCLRNAYTHEGRFGCSINPRRENLAATQEFLSTSKLKGTAWREKLRETLGKQDIEIEGVDPRTRLARVLVEADYRMKLVGMGLEDGTAGVRSYLDSLELGKKASSADVVRWWFALNYDAIRSTEHRDAFQLHGQGVKVLSENELLSERGERIHTGKSDEPTSEFAHSFTRNFNLLADKYPVYAELRNVFDMALVAAIIHSEDLPAQVGWAMAHFGPEHDNGLSYEVDLGVAPKEVDTVMNHRQARSGNTLHTVVGVSGGVAVDTNQLVRGNAIKVDDYGAIEADHAASKPPHLPRSAWWWD